MTDDTFPPAPTRAAGLQRLSSFLDAAGQRYARHRNEDHGPEDRSNVSCLSPWLRHRLLLEEEVAAAARDRHGDGADKFVQEIFWRTYFKGWMEHHPDAWRNYQRDLERSLERLDTDASLADRHDAAVNGATGIDCFDAWSAELRATGYLHNHARMWFASIWVYTLDLPWVLGADFFLRHLLDGDPASNTLGWRWVCGLHTRGKTYLARAGNIRKFTGGRFDPTGHLAQEAPALIEEDPPERRPLALADDPPREPFGLLVTEEDCDPSSLLLHGPPRAALGLLATDGRSPLGVAKPVRDFARGAVEDALRHTGLDRDHTSLMEWSETERAAWPGKRAVAEWAQRQGVRQIVTAHVPVGPAAKCLEAIGPALCDAGIELLRIRRGWDERAWPHADRGYFKLRKCIPALLHAAGKEALET